RAGLRQGDVVTHANGIELQDAQALRYRIATQPIGGTANLTVLRKGRELKLSFDLQPPPEIPARNETVLEGAHPFAGAKIANLNPAYAEELGLDGFTKGVIVTGVARGSPADRLSLRPGDIVLQVNGRKIGLVRELQQALSGRAQQWQLSIRRGDRVLETTVQG
ncbi:MAG: PDZ domain-containing protein, partial [Oceanibaculum nanhaiense]|nr:PDZ domain-containing protein [Oceanibaculum nanhaiense]